MSEPTPNLRVIDPAGPAERGQQPPAHARTSWTAAELMATRFPEPKWAVPGLITEGVSLLAGPPKVGKSYLCLGLAHAVATGGQALEGIPVDAGDVLYLALEDTGRRLQNRMRRILGGQRAPSQLTLATTCPAMPQGGDTAITSWLERHPHARMIVLDVLAKMRGPSAPGVSAYDADYAAISRVKNIADHHGVAIVLVHHVRKASSEDFLAEVSGTNGLAGAADTTLVLKRPRGSADGVLHVTGRDVDETEYALGFQPDAGSWHLLDGPPEDHTLPETRAAILRYLRDHPGAAPKTIAEATGLAYDNVKRTCARMAGDHQLTTDAAGHYRPPPTPEGQPDHPEPVPPVPTVPQPPLTCENARDSTVPLLSPAVSDRSAEEEPS
ncbi:MAG: AAA family ATPase [Nocardioidaceae bacterium]